MRKQDRHDPIDARDKLEEEVFSCQSTADGRVLLYWHGKCVTTLAGAEAKKFQARIEGLTGKEAQLVMAKFTGNFKRGNERRSS